MSVKVSLNLSPVQNYKEMCFGRNSPHSNNEDIFLIFTASVSFLFNIWITHKFGVVYLANTK